MSSYPRSYGRGERRSGTARWARIAIAIGLLLLVAWLAFSALQLVRAGRSLLAQQQRLESLMEAGILNADAGELERIAVTAREDVVAIKRVAGPFTFLGPALGWLPEVGPLLADSQALLEIADRGSEASLHAITGLKPVIALNAEGGVTGNLPTVVSALQGAGPELAAADIAAARMFQARSQLANEEQYPERVLALLSRVDENAGLIGDGLKLAQIAPALLGYDRPQTYLILAQNEDELRPTGGFISGAGQITFNRGQITALSFDNANLIDDWQNKPYELPPAPYTEFMGMDIFLFRDANFWPDFPTSAAQAQALYSYGQDVSLDGVIAIDQNFLQQMLATTGPLPVPELERIVDASSVVAQLREEWGPGGGSENWIIERKAFMAPLANAFRAQLESGLLSTHGFELVKMLQRAAEERHLQLYVADPEVAELLNQSSWSGRLAGDLGGDFVHVADSNMGFNKVNAAVERALTYRVTLHENGGVGAQLEIHYSNPPASGAVECQHGTRYSVDTLYESLTSDCYWNYVRAYAPQGSVLRWASQHPVPAENLMSGAPWTGGGRTAGPEANGFTVFDNFLLLRPGQEETVAFHYDLPERVLESDGRRYNYRLHVRKQAGSTADMASISITLPPDAALVKTTPEAISVQGQTLNFELTLSKDALIDVTYQR